MRKENSISICHPDKPYLARGMCKSCYMRTYRTIPENKEKAKKCIGNWRENNREKAKNQKISWATANPEKVKETKRKYVSRNLHLYRAQCAKRHAAKLKRTVKWADLKAIKEFYLNCPKGMEVDHIIPLQGKTVSGLHVLNNLQYLTKSENCKKGNKLNESNP